MANILPKAQAITLLQKLSTDDKFRASYQANPREALLGLGISADLLPKSMAPVAKLDDKKSFADALKQVSADAADCHACLVVPHIQMRKGK